MNIMTANEIRRKFLTFFESKGHHIVPSAPIVVKNDPTLMFTNAGMNQFKDWFLGNEEPRYKRVADTQKCLRVSGKHNDLEEVGVDTYHHTMFEMLGNWSFGDYFKKEAIEWAWELLVKEYQLEPDRLYVTVFEGDENENLAFDEEAKSEWLKWIAPERILNGNKKDNFWEMGDTGPCGPCSEIHIDLRPDSERESIDAKLLVNNDHPQVIEIWNLVFMEFNRKADGSLEKLPAQHVDTGMGFERLCRAIANKSSNYDTDVFMPLINKLEAETQMKYGQDEKVSIAMRVIADHIRTISFAIVDGQLPSNTGAGYVIRRILRRAVRYYFSFLNQKSPLLHALLPLVANGFSDIFPELNEKQSFVAKVIKEEESSFLRTLGIGLDMLDQIFKQNQHTITGEQAFNLYDTHGFPIDLTKLIAAEAGRAVDEVAFQHFLNEQKQRSRKAAELETGDWIYVAESTENTVFLGYDQLTAQVHIVRYRLIKSKGKQLIQLVLNQTPFYAESGGQVGDSGTLTSVNETIKIVDTQKENNLIIHICDRLPESLTAQFFAEVEVNKRSQTTSNHSATHLLHAALRNTLGKHVEQKGSLVSPEYLRFDFSHFQAVSKEELLEIETTVNQKIMENISILERRNVPIAEAQEMGAMALFGEKYGEFVRVIAFDSAFSIELCGGTHVQATGEIGFFKIISESAVAAGVRRIEAISGIKALNWVNQQVGLLSELKEKLKSPDPAKSIDQLLAEKSNIQKKLETLELEKTQQIKAELLKQIESKQDIQYIVAEVSISNADQLKNLSFQLKNEVDNLIAIIAANIEGKPILSIIINEDLVAAKELNASLWVKNLSRLIKGGGGGQAFYATAGGSNPEGIAALLTEAKQMITTL